ncbi:hypothetical protein COLO4_33687 [Corchorus olitorius]|uniref:Uncharacterized protein n=1 Tax=Corchorus olitorius TaxID=93759 RepID=A0A1R3GS73_9ROSI|nr:hypothetical protein COLO4_33687 [Corchorus olitorius]
MSTWTKGWALFFLLAGLDEIAGPWTTDINQVYMVNA